MDTSRVSAIRYKVIDMDNKVYQFKITLNHSKPPIWRRIQAPETFTFWDLHCAIQDAMGWKDCHLHAFRFRKSKKFRDFYDIGIPDDTGLDMGTLAGWEIDMKKIFKETGTKCIYEYDFGDGWEHVVILEKIITAEKDQKYPSCIAGKRACPPEDCGGLWGYYELIEVLKNPKKERYQELSEWLGNSKIDSESFNPKEVEFTDPEERLQNLLTNVS